MKLTLLDRLSILAWVFKRLTLWSAVMARNRRMRNEEIQLIPRAREKEVKWPYQDPTQVSLAEKAKT